MSVDTVFLFLVFFHTMSNQVVFSTSEDEQLIEVTAGHELLWNVGDFEK